jgi:hypothetical protein
MTPEEEARLVAAAESALEREFPAVPGDEVQTAVNEAWKAFERARIRDFVPLLVQRNARDSLRSRGGSMNGIPVTKRVSADGQEEWFLGETMLQRVDKDKHVDELLAQQGLCRDCLIFDDQNLQTAFQARFPGRPPDGKANGEKG